MLSSLNKESNGTRQGRLSFTTRQQDNSDDSPTQDNHTDSLQQPLIHRVDVADSGATKLSVRHLTHSTADGRKILDDVSLDVPRGAIVGLIGPSGSGKSTLLRSLNRLWEPPAGAIFLDGEDVTALDVISVRRRVGMLFQKACLFDGTVADNIRYGPSLCGQKVSEPEVRDLLSLASLAPSFAPKPVQNLSGGEAQRVSLARTLANKPEVLLLDEPTSALDPNATLTIEASIRKLRDTTGVTVVLVSHNIEQVINLADIVYLLVGGKVLESCHPQDIYSGSNPLMCQFAAGELSVAL